MLDTLTVAFYDDHIESQNIEERAFKENEFLELKHSSPLLDCKLDELGEFCQNAHFCKGYHFIICTLRVCLVTPDLKSFFLPPMKSTILDAFVEDVGNDCLLVAVAVRDGVYFSTICFCSSPKVSSNLFFPLRSCPSKIFSLKSTRSVLCCYYEGGIEVLSLCMNDNGTSVLAVSTTGNKRGWLNRIANRFYSRKYRSSFFDVKSGSLIVLYDSIIELYTVNTQKLFELVECFKCPSNCILVIGSSDSHFIAYLVHSSGDLTPISLAYNQPHACTLILHQIKEIPLPLALRNVSIAATGVDTVIFSNRKNKYASVLCEKCMSLRSGKVSDLFTIFPLDSPVSAISLNNDDNTFILYHANGRISLVKHLLGGEISYRQLCKVSDCSSLVSHLSSSIGTFRVLDAMYYGLSFSTIRLAWNEIMIPYQTCREGDQTVFFFNLSHGAKGCAKYFAQLLQSLHNFYSSPYREDLHKEIHNLEEKIMRMYRLVQNILKQEGWLEGVRNDSSRQGEWNEELQIPNLASSPLTLEDVICAQADFLRTLMHFVFRSLGYTLLLRILKKEFPNFPQRSYTLRNSSGFDWMEFISRSDLEDWEDSCCLELLQVLMNKRKKLSHKQLTRIDPFSQIDDRHSDAIVDPLYHDLEEVAHYLSKESQIAVHLYRLVYKLEYEAALKYFQENFLFFFQSNLSKAAISLIEEQSPTPLSIIKLLLEVQCACTESSIVEKNSALVLKDEILIMLFERLEKLDGPNALLDALQYAVRRIESATPKHDTSFQKLDGAELNLLPFLPRRSQGTKAWPTSHITIASAICSWMEKHALDHWRIPVFETVLKNSKALWGFYLDPPHGQGMSREEFKNRSLFASYQKKTSDYGLSYFFFHCVVLSVKGDREAVHDAVAGFSKLARSDCTSLALSVRLEMINRASSLASSQMLLVGSSSFVKLSPQDLSFSELQEMVNYLKYHLLLQEQLKQCVEKHCQKHMGCSSSVVQGDSHEEGWASTCPVLSLSLSCGGTCPLVGLEDDAKRLQYLFFPESELYPMAVRYRCFGGASIELDLLKIHPDAGEEAVESAMEYLLRFLTDSLGPQLDAEEVVRSLLQDSFLLEHFYAPFPWDALTRFMLCSAPGDVKGDSRRGTGDGYQRKNTEVSSSSCLPLSSLGSPGLFFPTKEINFLRVVRFFLETPISPISLFFFLCRILRDLLNHEDRAAHQGVDKFMEFKGDGTLSDEVGAEKEVPHESSKRWYQRAAPAVSPAPIYSLPTVLPLSPETPDGSSATTSAGIQAVDWKHLIPVADIISSLQLVLSYISSEEERLHCEAQLQVFPVELFEA